MTLDMEQCDKLIAQKTETAIEARLLGLPLMRQISENAPVSAKPDFVPRNIKKRNRILYEAS